MVDHRRRAPSVRDISVKCRSSRRRDCIMRGNRWRSIGVLAVAVALISGCQTAGSKRPATVVSPAPVVGEASEPGGAVAERTITTAPVQTTSFADRHPLFYKPRQYWETAGDNKVAKVARATFIGVPAGFVGEVKQIFVGAPPQVSY
jgi:hypothetical protein